MNPSATFNGRRLGAFARFKVLEVGGGMARVIVASKRIASFTFGHLLLLGGFASIAYGFWMIWHPLGFMVAGWFGIRLAVMVAEEQR